MLHKRKSVHKRADGTFVANPDSLNQFFAHDRHAHEIAR
jgi:hypothetical protein